MVRDGYYYGIALIAAGVLIGWLTSPWFAVPAFAFAAFFLWFFRDPERVIPATAGAVVSPADGKVTYVSPCTINGIQRTRISIFLNVFDVHVNRSPIGGVIREARYQPGKFLNAMNETCAEQNEQNVVTVEGEGQTLIFKQIAGLLARRIVFTKKVGDPVARGERIGMMKFGSRMDVFLDSTADLKVRVGDRVKGGSSVLAYVRPESQQLVATGAEQSRQGAF